MNLQQIVYGIAASLLLAIGAWTGSTLNELSDSVQKLEVTMARLTVRMDALPPKHLTDKIERMEKEISRAHVLVDRIERRIMQIPPEEGDENYYGE